MNENATIDMERDQNDGQITYANDVIATIVSVATAEVDGISGIAGGGSLSGILAKGKAPRGVRVDMNGEDVKVDVSVTVDYGMPIQKVGRNAQENVRKSIESMTGLHVNQVDLHVVGVSFEKDKLGAVKLDGETGEYFEYFTSRQPESFHGTGDLFTSAVAGGVTRGMTIDDALRLACDLICESIRLTIAEKSHNTYGVNFEQAIPYLLKRAEDIENKG